MKCQLEEAFTLPAFNVVSVHACRGERWSPCVSTQIRATFLGDWWLSHEQSAFDRRLLMCGWLAGCVKCSVIALPCLHYAHRITAVFCEAPPLSAMDTCIISEADGGSKLFQKSIRGPTKLISLWVCSSNCVCGLSEQEKKQSWCPAAASLHKPFHQPHNRRWLNEGASGTDQGWEPNPYHASWRIWKPRPSRMVFLFPIERIRIPKTTVWKRSNTH